MSRRRQRPRTTRSAAPPRRGYRWIVLACAAAGAAALLFGAIRFDTPLLRGAQESARPNVLLITIDTLRWDHVGCYGSADATTPALDALAARGARFETAVMHTPLTAPSHASILTGVTPLRHGVRDNGAFVVPPELGSLPTVLKRAGYETAAFVSGFPLDRRFGFANGFDTYDDRLPRGRGAPGVAHTERRADSTTDAVLDWLGRRTAAAPWFLWVHYFDPHAPYEPPADFHRRFASKPYDGEIAFVDREVGRLFDRLRDGRALAQTIVLVTADHGESLGDHGEETHGVFVYDATIRVPFVVAGPGVPKGIVPGTVARGVDVMPTLLDLAGVAPPATIDGRSLEPAFGEHVMADAPAYIESLMAQRHLGWSPVQGLRDARWKFIRVPRRELYNLRDDPGETRNRAESDSDRTTVMTRHLQAQLAMTRTSAARAPDRSTGERLRALGYLGGGTAVAESDPSRDPKDGIAVINRLEHAIAAIRVDPGRAADELRAVLTEEPGSELARRQLAAALSAMGDHPGAVNEIRTLHSHGAATAEDLLLLAESLRVQGQTTAARRAVEDASRMDPRSPEAALTRARMLMSEERPEGATSAYRNALELSPDHPEALVGLGNLALAGGDVRAASAYFERVLARDPTDLPARAGLGLVRGREGRMPEAIALLQQVVRESPGNAEALAGLGAALARTGQPAAAVPYFQRAVAAGLRTPAVLNGLGFARLEAGDRAGALEALRSSLAIRPDQPRVQEAVRELAAQGSHHVP